MEKSKSQKEWAIDRLLADGYVSRNGALQNFITRLSAIILNLKEEGWELSGRWYKEGKSKDFRYYLLKSPYKKQTYILPDGREITKIVTV